MMLAMVSRELKEAFRAATRLPPEAQRELAALIMEEIADEERWAALFADPRSEPLIARLAAEAVAEDDAGLTEPCD
ncbi:hypothetical protein HRbin24_00052 [bacterium HR24]|nr:hypothetical protein HRbin24_00052 [bacterium HR24]